MCGIGNLIRNDAIAKATGQPTRGFHNITPNYNHPEIIASMANMKSKESAPPPVLRNDISTGSSNLRISQRKDRSEKRTVTSGRRTSKVKRFSTRGK
jgi:hypothetical protein|tara:strand:+ start:314 stop:604 length:291 start_codon:yes stop_codon:yes gene_type:complete